ncbi:MAG: YidC/Oxa1 family membrane protein insertase [Acetivibrionales bacterium]|jgi:YidC/Oxa1 family membrane protein insertase
MLDFIAYPLGQILYFIYNNLSFFNYGLAIILFTLFTRLVLLPLTIKQYKSTAKMQLIQPQIQEIQKRYKNDKEKLNQELMKVYQENNINPAGGCLPLLIQMPILISLYWVITQPLKFMLNKTPDQIDALIAKIPEAFAAGYSKQIGVLDFFGQFPEKLAGLENLLLRDELINLSFLGLNLGKIPTYKPDILFGPEMGTYLPLLIFPIVGVITTFISAKISMLKSNKNDKKTKDSGMAGSMSNSMLYMGPVLTLIFSFQLPAGVILYWIAGYVFQIFQQLYINKHVIEKKEVAS